MSDIVERLRAMNPWTDMDWPEVKNEAAEEITALRARIDKLEKALEESRETNRRLHRRVQIAEAVGQSAEDYLNGWIRVFTPPSRRFAERHYIQYILRDIRYRVSKLAARAALTEAKG